MNISICILFTTTVCAVLGFTIPYSVQCTIKRKRLRLQRDYLEYRKPKDSDILFNVAFLMIASTVSFTYFPLTPALLAFFLSTLALYGIRIDQQYRIIPNELVLVIAIVALINHLLTSGIKGVISGIIALIVIAALFFGSAVVTRILSKSIGVGAGDIKLAMALALFLGVDLVIPFMFGIAGFLVIYIVVGFVLKTISIGSSFPMCTQIMGGFLFVIYQPFVHDVFVLLLK